MKHLNKKFIFNIISILLLLFSSIANATGPRVTPSLLIEVENEIFAVDSQPFIDSDVPLQGIYSEITTAAFAAVGIKSTLTILPVSKMVKYYLNEEQALAVYGQHLMFSDDEKKSLLFVPIALVKEQYFYYQPHYKEGLNWHGKLSDLIQYKYGTYKNQDISTYKELGVQVVFSRRRTLLNNLVSAKYDFIHSSALSVEWALAHHLTLEKDNIVSLSDEYNLTPQFVVFNKKHPKGAEMSQKLQYGLSIIIQNGEYKKILEKYLVDSSEVDNIVEGLKELDADAHH